MTTCKPKSKRRVYDILPPTTAVIGYVIGLRKLSSNGQFLVGAQMSHRQVKLYRAAFHFQLLKMFPPAEIKQNDSNRDGRNYLFF